MSKSDVKDGNLTKQCYLCGETIEPDQIELVEDHEGQSVPICADKHEPEWYRD